MLHEKKIDRSIYVTDGVLTDERVVDQNGHQLNISGGILLLAQESGDLVSLGPTAFPLAKLNVRNDNAAQWLQLFANSAGTYLGHIGESNAVLNVPYSIGAKLDVFEFQCAGLDEGSFQIGGTRTPANNEPNGSGGAVCWDANYLYVKTSNSPHTWKRIALSTY